MKTYIFTHTPSHGYLRVPKDDLVALGMIEDWEFNFFYDRGNDVEIEEDEDVPEFLRRAKEKDWEYEVINQYVYFIVTNGMEDRGAYPWPPKENK